MMCSPRGVRTPFVATESGSLGDKRHAEWPLLARLPKYLLGQIGATAASAGAAGSARQILEGPGAIASSPADHVFSNGIADADVHGLSVKVFLFPFNCK